MSGPARLTRRSLAAVLAGAAAPRVAQPAQPAQSPAGNELDQALERNKQQIESIKKVKLTAGIEPAFRFEP